MRRFSLIASLVLAMECLALAAAEPQNSAAVKKLAEALGDATIKGDFAKVIDQTYPGVINTLGGRDQAIKATESGMKQLMAQGMTIKSFKAGEPGAFLTEGVNTFVIVPTTTEVAFPGARGIIKSYLLGISSDGGKSWKFADGAGLDNKELRDKILPKLPAKLTLPEKQKTEIIKDG